jgi:P-type Cu+ transporter
MGKPVVVDLIVLNGRIRDEQELLRLAASVERGSEHPLGRAVVDEAQRRGIHLSEPGFFKASRGAGVSAKVDGRDVMVGKPAWFKEYPLLLEGQEDHIRSLQDQGKTVMVVAVDQEAAGLIAVADQPKPESKESIAPFTGKTWR